MQKRKSLRHKRYMLQIWLACLPFFLYADIDSPEAELTLLSRSDSIPAEIESASDAYFEGYLQALVDMHYAEYRVVVIAKEKKIWLANLPKNELLAKSIIQ